MSRGWFARPHEMPWHFGGVPGTVSLLPQSKQRRSVDSEEAAGAGGWFSIFGGGRTDRSKVVCDLPPGWWQNWSGISRKGIELGNRSQMFAFV